MLKGSITSGVVAAALLTSSFALTGAEAARKRPRLRVPGLVNVDLRNVLNNLSVRLHLDRANVPVNAQIPITLAANICGVSVNVLAISAANGKGNCVAKTSSPRLAQVVQQQIAAGGNVGGGAQGGSSAGNAHSVGAGGAASAGATGTAGASTGAALSSGSVPANGTAPAQTNPAAPPRVAGTATQTPARTPVGSAAAGAGTAAGGGSAGSSTGSSIPALVNVNLQNVLNDLSVQLNVDRANIPVNAQVPIDVAANVCGVSVNVLALSTGGKGTCTAKTASPQLAQVVQQQVAAGGSVGGGAQGGSSATTGRATGTGGSSTSGSSGTGGTSSGMGNPPPPPTPPH